MEKDLKNLNIGQLAQICAEAGKPAYQAGYIFDFIHKKHVTDIAAITTISKDFRRELIEEGFFICSLKVLKKQTDADGTVKYLFELPDGKSIESVLLFDRGRRTLCISSQAGCAMGCLFCATAKLKLQRSLAVAEILEQVYAVESDAEPVTNVVYMGMGEPLANYEPVMRSVEILNHSKGRNLAIRRITLSTCGLPDEIARLADEPRRPRLAVSLNAAENELRSRLMPINRKFPLAVLFEVLTSYQRKTGDRITFEYVMIAGVNDHHSQAKKLAALVKPLKCNVNLIQYNPHSGCDFIASSANTIRGFGAIVTEAGIETTVRMRMGTSIKAACGQLGADNIG